MTTRVALARTVRGLRLAARGGALGAVVMAMLVATTPVAAAPATFRPPTRRTTGIYAGPPVKLLLLGDSTALTLGFGLAAYEQDYDVAEFDEGLIGCGIAEGSEYQLQGVDYPVAGYCDGSDGSEQWPQLWQQEVDTIRPNVVMILAGRWEVMNRTYQGRWTDILNPGYAAYVERQLRLATRVAGSRGARVVLLTAPCYDGGDQADGQPWPEDSPRRVAAYNAIVRHVGATTRGTTVVNFHAMACPSGHYQSHLDGVDARYDGVHFTLGGGVVFEPVLFPLVARLGRQQMAAHRRVVLSGTVSGR